MPCDTATTLYAVSTFFQWATIALSATGTALPQLMYFTMYYSWRVSSNYVFYQLGPWQLCGDYQGCQGISPMSDFYSQDGYLIQSYRAFSVIGLTFSLVTGISILIRTILWSKRSKSAPVFDGLMLATSMWSIVSLIISVSVASVLYTGFSGLTWYGNNYVTTVSLGASFIIEVVSAFTGIVAFILHALAVRSVRKHQNTAEQQPGAGGMNDQLLQQHQHYQPSPFQHPQPLSMVQPIYAPQQPIVNVYAPSTNTPNPYHYHSPAPLPQHIQYAPPHQPIAPVIRYPIQSSGGYVN